MLKIIKLIKKSRPVKFKDIFRVLIDSWKIKWLMRMPFEGRFPNASSISHCQLEGTQNDPLKFFVLGNDIHLFRDSRGQVKYKPIKLKKYFGFPYPRTIINPEIIWHNEKLIKSREGCMSQPDTPPMNVTLHVTLTLTMKSVSCIKILGGAVSPFFEDALTERNREGNCDETYSDWRRIDDGSGDCLGGAGRCRSSGYHLVSRTADGYVRCAT